jgi:hypothetical protein
MTFDVIWNIKVKAAIAAPQEGCDIPGMIVKIHESAPFVWRPFPLVDHQSKIP